MEDCIYNKEYVITIKEKDGYKYSKIANIEADTFDEARINAKAIQHKYATTNTSTMMVIAIWKSVVVVNCVWLGVRC